MIEAFLYFLCFLASATCALLLLRAYRRSRTALLVWSAACFAMLAINNLLVFVDFITGPSLDLASYRLIAALIAICLLLYGFIWEL
jgi:Family of unknown function (DUF5985)